MTQIYLIAAQFAFDHKALNEAYRCLKLALGAANRENDQRKGMILAMIGKVQRIQRQVLVRS